MINSESKKPQRKRQKHVDLKLTEKEFEELGKIAKKVKLSKQDYLHNAAFDK